MRTFCRSVVLGMVVGLFAFLTGQASAGDAQQKACDLERTIKVTMKYLLYLPKDYEQKPSWPLMLFLHGSGEKGDDLSLVKKHGPPKLIEAGKEFPFIVVSPQCPSRKSWEPYELSALLDEMAEKYKVDQDRIYVTGLSMGGFGTWALAAHTPNRFAAIVPICGGGDPNRVRRLAHIPVWVFHGAKDPAVPLEMSQKMVEALKKAGGDAKFTVYPEAGHDSWTEAYNDPQLYEWLLRQKRMPEKAGDGKKSGNRPAIYSKGTKPSAGVAAYVPEPQPVGTPILVGAHNCPLWEADKPQMWNQVLKHPERTPALGFYSQDNPEVADWETKWAVEHGISFFVYCWYRNGQGGPVKMHFGSAIHDALLKSRYVSKMKFTIMWENQARGTAGVSSEADLLENLLPFWIQNYFRHSSYLKIDNKPLLFIYRPEFLVQDLGGVEKARAALDKMRAACKKAGFDGLYLLGEYRGLDPKPLELMKQLGLDYTFAYCWYVPGSPKPQQAIAAQLDYIDKTRRMGVLPEVVTVSQGWSGWRDEGSIWKIPPAQYKELLEKAKAVIRTFPASELGSKLLLLDNWNEWSEGHYIAPHREYGFGYLDAVREVFSDAPKSHIDLLPSDVGMGPYDQAYKRPVSPRR